MCRLFGMHAGKSPVKATFWLLNAPDSLEDQSHREPDGAGIGVYERTGHGLDAAPWVTKQPIAAWADSEFATAAMELESTTFLAHVRYASSGSLTTVNTHPFEQDGRLFAHNGTFEGLDKLDARLAQLGASELVLGQTDSERMFALITAEARQNNGDIGAAITSAVSWIAANLPIYSLNLVLTTATELWALRYPDTHELYVLERAAGGESGSDHLHAHSNRIRAKVPAMADAPAVVVATERMDTDPAWRMLDAGELLHVDSGLISSSSFPLPSNPAHQLTLADLDPAAAASQHPA